MRTLATRPPGPARGCLLCRSHIVHPGQNCFWIFAVHLHLVAQADEPSPCGKRMFLEFVGRLSLPSSVQIDGQA